MGNMALLLKFRTAVDFLMQNIELQMFNYKFNPIANLGLLKPFGIQISQLSQIKFYQYPCCQWDFLQTGTLPEQISFSDLNLLAL